MSLKLFKSIVFIALGTCSFVSAQNVGIGIASPDPSAKLHINASDKGLLIPRLSLSNVSVAAPVTSPATGLLVFNTNAAILGGNGSGFYYWNGTQWVSMLSGGDHDWYEVGTTTAPDNINDNMYHLGGNVGIGTSTPNYKFSVVGEANVGEDATGDAYLHIGKDRLANGVSFNRYYSDIDATMEAEIYRQAGTNGNFEFANVDGTGEIRIRNNGVDDGTGGVIRLSNSAGTAPDIVINDFGLVGIGISPAGTSSAQLEVAATNRGVLIPRIALTARNVAAPVTSPATSLLVYNTATAGVSPNNVTPGYYYWNGSVWVRFATGGAAWELLGNAGTVASTNFIGTTDNVDFVTRTNNVERMRVKNNGYVGINTNDPKSQLHVNGSVSIGGLIDIAGGSFSGLPFTFGDNRAALWFGDYQGRTVNNDYGVMYGEALATGPDTVYRLNICTGDNAEYWSQVDEEIFIGNLYHGNSSRKGMLVKSGRVGIGTLAPIAQLHAVANHENNPVIYGVNTNTTAGTTSFGVRGECGSTGLGSAGVSGVSTNSSQNEIGIVGDYSLWGTGGFGLGWAAAYTDMPTSRDHGLFGTCNFSTGTGVYAHDGSNSTGSRAIYAVGKTIATGTKSASVPTSKGNQLLYCTESPEVWFEDYGKVQLKNGIAHVAMDDLFLETVFIDATHDFHVFMQEQGECNGLYYTPDSDFKGFTIREKNGGTSNVFVSYKINAKRRFYQDQRFGVDASQPFGNNLVGKKDAPVTPSDPEVMRRRVEAATRAKEEFMRANPNATNEQQRQFTESYLFDEVK